MINFDCLKSSQPKICFIIARATIGYGIKDQRFDWYWSEMKRIGVCRAAYHVAYPSQGDYKRQAENFLKVVKPSEHDRLAIDLELQQGVGKRAMTDFTNDFIRYLRLQTGRTPILYSRKNWLENYLYPEQLISVDLWLAQYNNIQGKYALERTCPPALPRGHSDWLIHQTGGYCVPFCGAASTFLDYDRWNGSEDDVRNYFGYGGEQPELTLEQKVEKLWQAHPELW
jgi:GH25 family lysozyme M1 (1,4-beta-N-acetylmuramidase)